MFQRASFWVGLLAVVLSAGQVPASGPRHDAPIRIDGHPDLPCSIYESGRPGPTVLIVGGVHGDEPAGAAAAGQIRHWPVTRGKLIVIPKANPAALAAGKRETPGTDRALANLNRNFPSTLPSDQPRGRPAEAIWSFIRQQKPDWLVDLHEASSMHRENTKNLGSTIIAHPQDQTLAAAEQMLAAVNATIPDPAQQFGLRRGPIGGSVARAAAVQLGTHAMIVETTSKGQAVSLRTRQHRIMVHRLLEHLEMMDPTTPALQVTPALRAKHELFVALYDGQGATGQGVPRVLGLLGDTPDIHVERVGPADIREGVLRQFDVVMFTGGSGSGQAKALDDSGREAVRRFVRDGGGYFGICAGSYLACSGFSWGLGVLDARTRSPEWRRGVGEVQIKVLEEGARILGLSPGTLEIHYANGPVLEPAHDADVPDYTVMCTFGTELAENNTPQGIMVGSPGAVVGEFGKGRVVCFSGHPEQSAGLKACVARTVRWVARQPD